MSNNKRVSVAKEVHDDITPKIPETTPEPPIYLSKEPIYFVGSISKVPTYDDVPIPTPNSTYDFESAIPPVPQHFLDLDDLEFPNVREVGVQKCIDVLAKHFGCNDYKNNLLQFWFLDIVTDCMWKAQDEFRFPPKVQKIVLGWVLYVIELIRDADKNLSRKKLFTIFKETVLVAGELVDEGHMEIPLPKDLISLINEEENDHGSGGFDENQQKDPIVSDTSSFSSSSSKSSSSSISVLTNEADGVSYVELKIDEEPDVFILPREVCNCDALNLSSISTLSDSKPPTLDEDKQSYLSNLQNISMEDLQDEEEMDMLEEVEFYQPDMNVPSRFLPLPEEDSVEETPIETPIKCLGDRNGKTEDDEEINQFDIDEVSEEYDLLTDSELLTESVSSTLSTIFTSKASLLGSPRQRSSNVTPTRHQMLKTLRNQKLLEQRDKDMDDPRKGWLPYEPSTTDNIPEKESDMIPDDDEWIDVIDNSKRETNFMRETAFYNFGILWAIIDFVFDYFYDSFQFTLIKLAFQAVPNIVSQKVNDEWCVPKIVKDELKKPPVKKAPPPKKENKLPKGKDKEDKGKKETKGKLESQKKKEKEPKEQKKKGKEKPKPLTKEEKEEIERLKREQEELEEEMRKIEENKRFVFPLTDAATDDLFKDVFDNWVKVEPKKDKKDNGKKGKK